MSKNRVKAFVRFRPTDNFDHESVEILDDNQTINIHLKKGNRGKGVNNQVLNWTFKVDGVLCNASQEQVYESAVSELATKALQGYNSTLLAYGQTGAGKTFTITGATENYKQRGAIPRAIAQIFRSIEEHTDHSVNVRVSYLEVYNETMFDLLSTLPESGGSGSDSHMTVMDLGDGTVYVKGLSVHTASNEGEALNFLFEGETNRAIAAHALNKNSSRSHCIFTIYIESKSRSVSNAKYVTSKFNLVDLAGSERIGKTGSEGQIQKEAMYINKSLSFLEQTVTALSEKNRSHIPYRQSKLTHSLKDSLGGNCSTTLIANVYGDAEQLEETVSTLRFALRMMCVPVEPTINEHFDPWLLVRELDSEIKRLKQELEMHNTLANRSLINYGPLSESQLIEIRKQKASLLKSDLYCVFKFIEQTKKVKEQKNSIRSYLEGKSTEIDVSSLREIGEIFKQFRLIVQELEQEMSKQLKNKYVLLDKSDSEAMVALSKAGLQLDDEGNFPGVVSDTSVQAATLASQTTTVSATRQKPGASSPKRKSATKKRASPTGRGGGSPSQKEPQKEQQGQEGGLKTAKSGATQVTQPSVVAESVDSAKKEGSGPTELVTEEKKTSRPSTPPSRNESFEQFKKEDGQPIYKILLENKNILLSKKRIVRDLAHAVNATKHMIDGTRVALERKKNERLEQGEYVNDEGETVIDEEEFELITQLKNLKQTYRRDYDELRYVKSEVEYCQKLVDQCRQKLVQEFDAWYSKCFLQAGEPETSAAAGFGVRPGISVPPRFALNINLDNIEDDQEKFDRVQQELLMEEQESAAFYNAKMKTRRRQNYEKAMAQAQIQTSKRNVPGIPQVSTRNKPPSHLSFAY